MKVIQRVIYCGFAAVAIASASMPVFPAPVPVSPAGMVAGSDQRLRDAPARDAFRDGTTRAAHRIERR